MDRPLSPAEIEQFETQGYVTVRGAFSKAVAERAVDTAFIRLGYDRDDPSTWEEAKVHMPVMNIQPMHEFSPKAWAAVCQLLGGEDRVVQPYGTSDAYIVNLRYEADRPWVEPPPKDTGWHKDGEFFRHFLDSPEQGLLTLVCYTDLVHQGGATFIARDSVPVVAKRLAANPQGLRPSELDCQGMIEQCDDLVEALAEAGDIILLHPYMLHSPSPNVKRAVRVITNPPAKLKEPMNFNREDPADFSPVERAVLRGLGVDRLDFKITGQREHIHSQGAKQREARLEAEKARLAAAGLQ